MVFEADQKRADIAVRIDRFSPDIDGGIVQLTQHALCEAVVLISIRHWTIELDEVADAGIKKGAVGQIRVDAVYQPSRHVGLLATSRAGLPLDDPVAYGCLSSPQVNTWKVVALIYEVVVARRTGDLDTPFIQTSCRHSPA